MESRNGDNFGSTAHELTAGFVAGMMIDAFGAKPIYDETGRATPIIEIPVPDDMPFPVRALRVVVLSPEKDFGPAEVMDAIADSAIAAVRMAGTSAALRTGLYEAGEQQRREEGRHG